MAFAIDTVTIKLASHSMSMVVFYNVAIPAGGSVSRRYSDFVWLRKALTAKVPGAVVPPLPHARGGTGNADPAFVAERKLGLAEFLNGCAAHAELGRAEALAVFLAAGTTDLQAAAKAHEANEARREQEAAARAAEAALASSDRQGGGGAAGPLGVGLGAEEWSRYGQGGEGGGLTSFPSPGPAAATSWFGGVTSLLSAVVPAAAKGVVAAASAAAAEMSPEDRKVAELALEVASLEKLAHGAFKALVKLTEARLAQCRAQAQWAQAFLPPPLTPSPAAAAAAAAVGTDAGADASVAAGAAAAAGRGEAAEEALPGFSAALAGVLGGSRQGEVLAAAREEQQAMAKAVTDRIQYLAAMKDALDAREQVRRQAAQRRADAAAAADALSVAEAKVEGQGEDPTAEGLQRRLDFQRARQHHARKEAELGQSSELLALATGRLFGEWARLNRAWALAAKHALLETVHTNGRAHRLGLSPLERLAVQVRADKRNRLLTSETPTGESPSSEGAHQDWDRGARADGDGNTLGSGLPAAHAGPPRESPCEGEVGNEES